MSLRAWSLVSGLADISFLHLSSSLDLGMSCVGKVSQTQMHPKFSQGLLGAGWQEQEGTVVTGQWPSREGARAQRG